ncbi:glycosyltransferase family 2 protein [Thermoactinomyces sp. DSM 45892]|uniref:glycosyltransferase family 2 protein n=1 Tax=Thermoactinomyces sp. DSM 45892 TaxID=1882753 RepID=UPI0008988ABA|nr:glycosyltransferase family 2 protein [Thermoactinomyces sp. DSM 45892]SDX97428.1 Glycosyltransferase involved in cell wall bisynthesis [Thermoactinomyces sp. DSM 45892]
MSQGLKRMFMSQEKNLYLPKVSVLISAFNRPHMLKKALESVLDQTYPNMEIIIGDGSTDDGVEALIRPYLEAYDHIKYVRSVETGRNLSSLANTLTLFSMATGEFINFLHDYNFFHREKIEKMVHSFLRLPNVKLVTSYRQLVDDAGSELPPVVSTAKLFHQNSLINGKNLGKLMLSQFTNFIGESTTVLFRKNDLMEGWARYGGAHHAVLSDVATWMSLLAQGDAVYIAEPLSYSRIHLDYNQMNSADLELGRIAEWASILRSSLEGQLIEMDEYQGYLKQWNERWDSRIHELMAIENQAFIMQGVRAKCLRLLEDIPQVCNL